jgi:uncharacterized protein (DUF427 family)
MRGELLLELGQAALGAGDGRATEHLREAVRLLQDADRRAAAVLELARALTSAGEPAEAMELLETSSHDLRDLDREWSLRLEAEIVALGQLGRAPAEAKRRLTALASELQGETPAERLLLAAMAWETRPADEAADGAMRAVGSGQLLLEQPDPCPPFFQATHILVLADRFDDADRCIAQALDLARERGAVLSFVLASSESAHLALARGDVVLAETERPLVIDEQDHGLVLYLPRDDVRMELLEPTGTVTWCPFKGRARHWRVAGGDEVDVAWSYEEPYPEVARLAGYLAFYQDRVSVEIGVAARRGNRP